MAWAKWANTPASSTVFEGALAKQYSLTEGDRRGLQRLQQLFSLRDEEVTEIEAIIEPLPPPPFSPPSPLTRSLMNAILQNALTLKMYGILMVVGLIPLSTFKK
ncbi:hypothetical protein C7B82_11475 [Stenomitos frigidus ULC18]|uniref:Uncharacterized protein n=2 Tax=Stenomitos TaxID=1844270 RepID=A0A2T1E9Q5_9CYAN|nr:hypothetical protein C7B82_11475 [Stenomitos frigidus ULC18]